MAISETKPRPMILCSFYPNVRTSYNVRVSFSLVDLEKDAEIGMSRLAGAIRDGRRQNGL